MQNGLFLVARLGRDLDDPYVQDGDLTHVTVATSAIRRKKQKTIVSAIAIHYFGIS